MLHPSGDISLNFQLLRLGFLYSRAPQQRPLSPTSVSLSSPLMNGALRVDFNYCSVEVGIGHALNWNETHFSFSGGGWRTEGKKRNWLLYINGTIQRHKVHTRMCEACCPE